MTLTNMSSSNKTRDLALVGGGYWGKNLVRNFHALDALYAICDAEPATLAMFDNEYSLVKKTTDFHAILRDQHVRKVAIATPAVYHYEQVKAALLAGKDVFVEKPLCLDAAQGAELVELAEQKGLVLMVGHLLQYHPCIRELHSLVAQGELGKLHYITSTRLNLGKIRREENALWSFAPHDISVILTLAGHQLPEEVHCFGEAFLTPGVADVTLTTLRFRVGICAHIYVSWLNPFKEQKLTVVGSHGMAVFDDTQPWERKLILHRHYLTWTNGQIPSPNKTNGEPVAVPETEPLRAECLHFLECCRDRHAPRTDGREGLRVLRVLQAAQTSLARHRVPVADGRGRSGDDLRSGEDVLIHPTAVVDQGAILGKGTKVWHFAHISKDARIGENCIFGQNTFVAPGVVIGNNVKVQNNVSIYSGTTIEDDVFLGPSCVLTNVTNPRSQVKRHALYEKTLIRRGATIGANATIVCGVTLGRYCFIAAGAVVTKDVPDYALMMGVPARQTGWISRHGHVLKNPGPDGVMVCPESGFRYRLVEPSEPINDATPRTVDEDQKATLEKVGMPPAALSRGVPPGVLLRCLDLDEEAPLPADLSLGKRDYHHFKALSAR
jgi:UDP-2-acetamido-3-amino-2,3-dideoxy-glucuronate N-acetyltransferase